MALCLYLLFCFKHGAGEEEEANCKWLLSQSTCPVLPPSPHPFGPLLPPLFLSGENLGGDNAVLGWSLPLAVVVFSGLWLPS